MFLPPESKPSVSPNARERLGGEFIPSRPTTSIVRSATDGKGAGVAIEIDIDLPPHHRDTAGPRIESSDL